ncbi:MAG: nucleotidyltransferase domain-containing protein [Bacillota bacterium]
MSSHEEVISIGCFGSLARGDWSVGSDAHLIVVVGHFISK